MPRSLIALLLAFTLPAFTLPALAQPCSPQWSAAFSQDGPSAKVTALVEYDPDGPGPLPPNLVIGGDFTQIGSTPFNHIAMWNGTQWLPLGAGLGGSINCLTVLDPDGTGPLPTSLCAGGNFTGAIVRWTGSAWVPIGSAIGPNVKAMTIYDDDGDGPHQPVLYAAGQLVGANNLAYFDGTSWIGTNFIVSSDINTLTVYDEDGPGALPPSLIAGGQFTTVGVLSAPHIARFDGTSWSTLGTGLSGIVFSLTTFDDDGPGSNLPALYAGLQGGSLSGIAKWTGSTWTRIGTRLTGTAYALLSADDDGPGPHPTSLIAIGGFNLTGPNSRCAARLENGDWVNMASGLSTTAYCGCTFDADGPGPLAPRIIAGGFFTTAPTALGATFTPYLAQWDSTAWQPIGPATNRGLDDTVYTLATYTSNGSTRLFAAGDFTAAGGSPAAHIAQWTGATWLPVLGGFTNRVSALVTFDPDGPGPIPLSLYAGGPFFAADGQPANHCARWDGSAWSPVGTALAPVIVNALAAADLDGPGPNLPRLYAGGGNFSGACVMVFNGTDWDSLPNITGTVYTLAEFDPDASGPLPPVLVAGGSFTINGSTSTMIATWNGSTWTSLPGLPSGNAVQALISYDDDGAGPNLPRLIAAGNFSGCLRAWNGATWQSLGTTLTNASDGHALISHDDDNDGIPSLFVAGVFNVSLFPSPGNIRDIARWNGSSWTALNVGTNDTLNALAAFDEDGPGPRPPALYAAGRFTLAGGLSSNNIARWGCGDPINCYANCDNSTASPTLTANDFQCFLNKFAASDPYANCDHSTATPILTANDFQCFLNAYAVGCP